MLSIHNSLTREKQVFVPIEPGRVRMYVCGITVYDYCHIGHARMLVTFDAVQRWLRATGYDVTYVRNITDIDDRIIKRAAENGESIHSLTERFIGYMNEDAAALGVEKPDAEPRATQHVPGMVRLIEQLMSKGLAYQAANRDVYYAVREFPGYGKLSGKSLEDLRAGERVEIDPNKRDPLDFVLWKAARPGEPQWESPFGPGRPGWHIECSAMSEHFLGEHFDLHGGGLDLLFPHHENEIAQSEGAHGHAFVNYWVHNGFVRVDNEKMSKSLGNFFTIREVLKKDGVEPEKVAAVAETIRLFILRSHYRSPLNYSDQHLDDARSGLTRLYTALRDTTPASAPVDWRHPLALRFKEAMDDDFNTADACAVLSKLANEVNRSRSAHEAGLLRALGGTLGLLGQDPATFLQAGVLLTEGQIDSLIAQRKAAREQKNFEEADRIRKELERQGVSISDTAIGATTWQRSRK